MSNENVQLQYLSQERSWPLCSPGKCCVLSLHPFPARKPEFQQKAQVRWFLFIYFPPIKSDEKHRQELSRDTEENWRAEDSGIL